MHCQSPDGAAPSRPLELPLEHLRGFVFDCDGVIIDSLGANAAYYNHFRERFGLPPMTPEQTLYVHSATVVASLDHILPAELRPAADAYRKNLDYRFVLPHLTLEPGLREVLTAMRARGYRLAVNTNRTSTMGLVIDHFGLHGFFDPVVQAGDVAMPKPHPEGLLRILAAWGVDPGQAAFIGDSAIDQATAAAGGADFWAYKNPELPARVHLTDFLSLCRCLAG